MILLIIVTAPPPAKSQAGMIEQCVPGVAVVWDSCSLPGKETGCGGGEPSLAASSSPARGLRLPVGDARESEEQPGKGQRYEMGKPKLCAPLPGFGAQSQGVDMVWLRI